MTVFRSIPIPGLTTLETSAPQVRLIGDQDTQITLLLSYTFYETDPKDISNKRHKRVGEISFVPVIGLRFCWAEFIYDEFREIQIAGEALQNTKWRPGLDEIVDSPYIEHMLSTNRYSHLADRMGGGGITEADVKHYRIEFDEYGRFDVLALGVSIKKYEA